MFSYTSDRCQKKNNGFFSQCQNKPYFRLHQVFSMTSHTIRCMEKKSRINTHSVEMLHSHFIQ